MTKQNGEGDITYFPELGMIHAVLDTDVSQNIDAVEDLYERVSRWTSIRGVILGEGTFKTVCSGRKIRLPDSVMLEAPVIDPGNLSNDTFTFEKF